MSKQHAPRIVTLLLPPGPLVRAPHPRRRTPAGNIIVAMNGRSIPFAMVGELLLPPPLRPHTPLDFAARLHECPVCFARGDAACWWAELAAIRSHCSHPSRLNLAIEDDVERYARSLRR